MTVRQRAKDQLPSVLLTLTSIIQALALEALWSGANEARTLWTTTGERVIGWVQVAAVFEGILLIWLYYAQLLMRFSWVPSLRDSVIPFGFGIGQFALTELLAPGQLAAWLYVFGALFAYGYGTSALTLRAAARDRDNDWFFEAGARNRYGAGLLTVGVCWVFAVLTQLTGGGTTWALGVLATVHVVLAGNIGLQRWYWERSLRLGEQESAPVAGMDPRRRSAQE